MNIFDIKSSLSYKRYYDLLAPSVFNPTDERLYSRAKKYAEDKNTCVYAYKYNEDYVGIVVFALKNNSAYILDIAVRPEYRGRGIGSAMIDFIFNNFGVVRISAETDSDAVGFYERYGFSATVTTTKYGTERYACVCDGVSRHYDLLIAEGNDPVHDPTPLREYMDKWDGQVFIDEMCLSDDKSVLEIGVGTGRLAARVALCCGSFCGIDLSPKTALCAMKNLAHIPNSKIIFGDFLSFSFDNSFDIIYSSLTFMHFEDKESVIKKTADLLKPEGRFVLSLDKNQSDYIDVGNRKLRVYPDSVDKTAEHIISAGLDLIKRIDTEFAVILVAQKGRV